MENTAFGGVVKYESGGVLFAQGKSVSVFQDCSFMGVVAARGGLFWVEGESVVE